MDIRISLYVPNQEKMILINASIRANRPFQIVLHLVSEQQTKLYLVNSRTECCVVAFLAHKHCLDMVR